MRLSKTFRFFGRRLVLTNAIPRKWYQVRFLYFNHNRWYNAGGWTLGVGNYTLHYFAKYKE